MKGKSVNENPVCQKCRLYIAPTQERKYKDTSFHARCIAILRAWATHQGSPVEVAVWTGRSKTIVLIDPEPKEVSV